MSATDLLSCVFRLDTRKLTHTEKVRLEARFISLIYQEFQKHFRSRCDDLMSVFNSIDAMEENMYRMNFVGEMINDILMTEEYSLSGIACHTRIPEEVLYDVVAGLNTNPTLDLSRRIFELHATVKKDFYTALLKKISADLD